MDFKQRNHWLVTGGAGFIGSHLVRTLAAQNQQVTVLDNLSNGNMQNLLSVQDKIHFINGDICDFKTCISASAGVDYVLHHAALVSVAQSMENPRQTLQTNVQGTQNILEALCKIISNGLFLLLPQPYMAPARNFLTRNKHL